ncbi:hypothetical protein F5148DRAFT_1277741 [Russula earlei]|uniref:Uncharacterized protein n=1 Tax=Russula earlei TaxID=71964 RepID=A0ACC0TXN1_9AGAM|nr:hypothetical protein F5148DRAFT_1277741 [Russula earlei]
MARLTFLGFIQDQYWKVEPVEHVDLTGKTVVVIGANVGLGFEAAKHFASMNPKRLVLGCRSLDKGQAAVQATGFKNAELALVDLARFSSVSAFADKFIRDGSQIDILVYNAAVALFKYSATADGWEETDVHYFAKLSKEEVESDNILQKLSDERYCTFWVMRNRYYLSKLFNVFFVRELTKRLPANSPILVNAINPGFCNMLDTIVEALLARTTEKGSRQLVWAAVGGAGREFELRGGYDESVEVLSRVEPKFESVLREILSS